MKNDRVILVLALIALMLAAFDGPFRYVLLGFSTSAVLVFVFKMINRNKTT